MVRIIVTVTKNGYSETIADKYREEDNLSIEELIKWCNEYREGWNYLIEISNYG